VANEYIRLIQKSLRFYCKLLARNSLASTIFKFRAESEFPSFPRYIKSLLVRLPNTQPGSSRSTEFFIPSYSDIHKLCVRLLIKKQLRDMTSHLRLQFYKKLAKTRSSTKPLPYLITEDLVLSSHFVATVPGHVLT